MTTTADHRAQLRNAVGRFRESERRRTRFDPVVHVGALGGPSISVTVAERRLPEMDREVRVELVSALLERAADAPENLWVTRPGSVELARGDLCWLAAGQAAFGAAGLALTGCYVITRHGWVDMRSGERMQWRRLRL